MPSVTSTVDSSTVTSASVTASINPSGSDRILVVITHTTSSFGASDITACTFKSVGLTKLLDIGSDDARTEIWYMLNPSTGSGTIEVTQASGFGTRRVAFGAFAISDAEQSAPSPTNTYDGGVGSISSMTISASADDLVIGGTTADANSSFTDTPPNTGYTSAYNTTSTAHRRRGAYRTSSGGTEQPFTNGTTGSVTAAVIAISALSAADLEISVHSTLGIVDVPTVSVEPPAQRTVSLPDTISLTDVPVVSVQAPEAAIAPSVSDGLTVTEVVSLFAAEPIHPDTSVFDSLSVTELVSASVTGPTPATINVFDSLSVTEAITILVSEPTPTINVFDTVDLVDILNSYPDSISIAEHIEISVFADTEFFASVHDTVGISDVVTIAPPEVSISVIDTVSISEHIATGLESRISVHENVGVTEHIATALESRISVHENVSIAEHIEISVYIANDGIPEGGVTIGNCRAMVFDGVDGLVELEEPIVTDILSVTIAAKILAVDVSNAGAIGGQISRRFITNSTRRGSYLFGINSERRFQTRYYHSASSAANNAVFSEQVDLNREYEVVFSNTGGVGRLYVDGVLVDENEDMDTMWSNEIQRINGARAGGQYSFLDGTMRDIRIFSRGLTTQEVSDMHVLGEVPRADLIAELRGKYYEGTAAEPTKILNTAVEEPIAPPEVCISVIDTLAIDESLQFSGVISVTCVDTVGVTEHIATALESRISVHENVGVTEHIATALESRISVHENVDIDDISTVSTGAIPLFVVDTVSLQEAVEVVASEAAGETISVFDALSLDEQLSSAKEVFVDVYSEISIAEEVQRAAQIGVFVHSEVPLAEDIARASDIGVAVFDAIEVNEDLFVATGAIDISVYSTLVAAEDVSLTGDTTASVFDTLSLEEAVSRSGDVTVSVDSSLSINEEDDATLVLTVNVYDECGVVAILDSFPDHLTITEYVEILVSVDFDFYVPDAVSDLSLDDVATVYVPFLAVSVYEELGVTEAVSTTSDVDINVYDELQLEEEVLSLAALLAIDIFDSINLEEETSLVSIISTTTFSELSLIETLELSVDVFVSIYDEITIAEVATPVIPLLEIEVYDEVNVEDVDTVNAGAIPLFIVDSVTVQEDITVEVSAAAGVDINVSDTISVTEATAVELTSFVSAHEEVGLVDEGIFAPEGAFYGLDFIALDEYVVANTTVAISVVDTLQITEEAVAIGEEVAEASEDLSLTESIQVEISDVQIFVYSELSATENVEVLATRANSDSLSIEESITIQVSVVVSAHDTIALSDSVSAYLVTNISVYDEISVIESSLISSGFTLTVYDAISTLDVALNSGESRISVVSTLAINDSPNPFLVIPIEVLDTVSLSDSVGTDSMLIHPQVWKYRPGVYGRKTSPLGMQYGASGTSY